MKLNKMPKEELELYSYIDLTKMILEEEEKICDLLELSDDEYTDKIGDYYTSLTTDKDFVLLEDGSWDLRDRQPVSAILSEDDEVYEEDDLEDIEEAEEDMEELVDDPDEDIDDDVDLDDLDDEDDDDLTIIDEEELED